MSAQLETLRGITLFAGLSTGELETIAPSADERDVPAGQVVLSEGAPAHEVVLLVDGAATVEQDGRELAAVGPGELLGEIAVVTRMSRTATVTTTAPSRLLVIGADAFRSLMSAIPALATGAWATAAARLDA